MRFPRTALAHMAPLLNGFDVAGAVVVVQQAYAALAGFLDAINRVKPEDFAKRVAFKPIIRVLARQCLCEEKFNRVTAVWWLHQFIKLGGQTLVSMFAQLLESVLHCISDPEPELREEAKATNLVSPYAVAAVYCIADVWLLAPCVALTRGTRCWGQDLLTLVKATDVDFELSPLLQVRCTRAVSTACTHVPCPCGELTVVGVDVSAAVLVTAPTRCLRRSRVSCPVSTSTPAPRR